MLINLHKQDVREATKMFKANLYKRCRKIYKQNVMNHTRLFGFKFRSYEKAKISYASEEYTFLEDDSCYGKREASWHENTIHEIELLTRHDVNPVVSLDLKYVKLIEKYLK